MNSDFNIRKEDLALTRRPSAPQAASAARQEKTVKSTYLMPEALHYRFRLVALSRHVKFGAALREAIEDYIAKYEK